MFLWMGCRRAADLAKAHGDPLVRPPFGRNPYLYIVAKAHGDPLVRPPSEERERHGVI